MLKTTSFTGKASHRFRTSHPLNSSSLLIEVITSAPFYLTVLVSLGYLPSIVTLLSNSMHFKFLAKLYNTSNLFLIFIFQGCSKLTFRDYDSKRSFTIPYNGLECHRPLILLRFLGGLVQMTVNMIRQTTDSTSL